MTHISIVVPFYNAQRYIEASIKGLLSQDYSSKDCEIIFVDNNSTDRSKEIVESYSRIKLVTERKQGAYAARNRGAREAAGEIIAFTDPDCVPSADWLRKIQQTMEYTGASVVVGRRDIPQDSLGLVMMAAYEIEKNDYVFNGHEKQLYFGYTSNMAVRRSLFDEIGPFLERDRGSDTVFVRRSIEKHSIGVFHYNPEIRVLHLEIDCLRKAYKKVFVYGASKRRSRHIIQMRPLSGQERMLLFRRTVERQHWSGSKSVILFALLSVGLGYWLLGNISAAWGSR